MDEKYLNTNVLLIGIVFVILVSLPNFIINGTVFANEETKSSTIGGIKVDGIDSMNLLSTVERQF